MKYLIHFSIILAIGMLAGCGAQVEASAEPQQRAQAHPATPGIQADALTESKWMWAYFTIWFRHGGKMLLRGPELSSHSAEGVYSLEGNRLETSVANVQRAGEYAHGALHIEGTPALRLPETRIEDGVLSGIVALVQPDGSVVISIEGYELQQAGIDPGDPVTLQIAGREIALPEGVRMSPFGLLQIQGLAEAVAVQAGDAVAVVRQH
jgi:hypothetical protein